MAYATNYLKSEEKDRYYRQKSTFVMADPYTNEDKECLEIRNIKRNVNVSDKNEIIHHKIKNTDDLMKLAYEYYGDRNLWWFIADNNTPKINDPYALPVGEVIDINPYNPRSYNY